MHDVLTGRYPSKKKDCFDLGAIQMQAELGDYKDNDNALSGQLHRYLPPKYAEVDHGEVSKTEEHLLRRWKKLAGIGLHRDECYLTYLDMVKEWHWQVTPIHPRRQLPRDSSRDRCPSTPHWPTDLTIQTQRAGYGAG